MTAYVPLALTLVLLAVSACGDTVADTAAPSPAPLTGCPDTYQLDDAQPWVPTPPSTDTEGRLAPDADPVEATICRYGSLREGPSALEGEAVLAGGLERIRYDLLLPERLDGQQTACTAMGGPRVPHLLHLRYADGELWVSSVQDVNSCEDTGNGDFVSSAYLGDQVAASYDERAWVPAPEARPPAGRCSPGSSGRLGQERALVPDGWTELLVCRDESAASPVPADTARRVVSILTGLDTTAGTSGCSGPPRTFFALVFRYPAGPPVSVQFLPGCEPPLANSSLDAKASPEQVAELEELLSA